VFLPGEGHWTVERKPHRKRCFDFVLLPLRRSALPITLPDCDLDAEVSGGFRHSQPEQLRVAEPNSICGALRAVTEGPNHLMRDGASQRRRD
jgi:hypothetical protein